MAEREYIAKKTAGRKGFSMSPNAKDKADGENSISPGGGSPSSSRHMTSLGQNLLLKKKELRQSQQNHDNTIKSFDSKSLLSSVMMKPREVYKPTLALEEKEKPLGSIYTSIHGDQGEDHEEENEVLATGFTPDELVMMSPTMKLSDNLMASQG